jgi:hypothetical protein
MKTLLRAMLLASLLYCTATAQTVRPTFVLEAQRTQVPLKIDGVLNESAWEGAPFASPFINKWPIDSGLAPLQTKVRVLFDNEFLYVAAISEQKKSDLIIQSLKRDQLEAFWSSDAFAIVLDPINQRANGFLFGVNAAGAQLESALTVQGSWTRGNENWDNKWFSATTIHEDYWVAELAIPFAALRFKDGAPEWGLNFVRADMKNNVYSTWSQVPLQFNGVDLGHTGTLRWAEKFVPETSRLTLIPFTSLAFAQSKEEPVEDPWRFGAGLDAKVAVSSSLNLDLTLRPDFSNVEVDRQMTNVTRFSLFFPERRNFFLENADLFTNYGSWQVMPFFSRKIGMQDGQVIPISAGARLSGNLTKGLRVGVMDIQTEATEEHSANNYFVTSLQQRVWDRSLIKFFGANRQTTRVTEGDAQHDFNRTYGGEFQYTSSNGQTTAIARLHTTATPESLRDRNYYSVQFSKNKKTYYAGLMAERVGENYINDFGFVPRLHNYDAARDTTVRIGHYVLNPWFGYLFYPKKSKLNLIEPNIWSVSNHRADGSFLERNTSYNLFVSWKNTSNLFVEAFQTDVALPFATDILGNDQPLPVDRYRFTHYRVRYRSDTRKAMNIELNAGRGDFYTGHRTEYGVTVNARTQPWGSFGIAYLENRLDLGQYGTANFLLVGPRSEISLRNNVWWTTFVQYNTQAENMNINSRIQWRFKPMSDIFVVYTDNYTDSSFKQKNRGLVFKLTYWLNL